LALMKLMFGAALSKKDIMVTLMVGLMAVGLPYGYLIGIIIGTILAHIFEKKILKGAD